MKLKTTIYIKNIASLYMNLTTSLSQIIINNSLTNEKKKANVDFEIILAKQKQLKEQYDAVKNKSSNEAYRLNQDLLIVSLYSLIPPNRDEIKLLDFTTTKKTDDNDYVYISKNDVLLLLNKTKKNFHTLYQILQKTVQNLLQY